MMIVDFTREPIVETVITPKEGCKIVVRSSKSAGQEEYFVDSVEVVSFGSAIFFRSQEKPKAFLVPVSDYEVLEVREARMVLKNVGLDRSIKIGGGRENKPAKEVVAPPLEKVEVVEQEPTSAQVQSSEETSQEARADKKRDKRRQQRRRRGREDQKDETGTTNVSLVLPPPSMDIQEGDAETKTEERSSQPQVVSMPFSSMLPPPPTLISETIGRYKENVLFKNAFYNKEEDVADANQENTDTAENIPNETEENRESGETVANDLHEIEPIKENDENLLIENFESVLSEKLDVKNPSEELLDEPEPSKISSGNEESSVFGFWGDVNQPTLFPTFEKEDLKEDQSGEENK